MKTKTKLTVGIGLLFIFITLLSIVGMKNLRALKHDTENILTDNYNSLQFARNMLSALEENKMKRIEKLKTELLKQENNITEYREKEVTQSLRENIDLLNSESTDSLLIRSIRKDIFEIIDMNMSAIKRKSEVAKETAEKAVAWIAVTGTLCFLISFILLVNLPSSIADPIRKLTLSIREIAAENYSERVHFESRSEFGELATSFNTMAEKLEEYNNSNVAKLMMQKQRIETLIENMRDPVIGLDEDQMIIFANNQALKVTGLKENEMIGKSSQEVALKNDLVRSLVSDASGSTLNSDGDIQQLRIFTDNREGYFEKSILPILIVPIGETEKKLVGHVIILRNVTEFKELDSAKTNLIATVSHEFKTPISSIKMSVQLLENKQTGSLNKHQRELVDSIKEDARRLLNITGELLNMTQLESGKIQLTVIPADSERIIDIAINATRAQARNKNIRIEAYGDAKVNRVLADTEKTAWVVTNLISNAIRYSYEDSTINIRTSIKNGKTIISVTDTGKGIPPEYKDKIFDRYYRIPGTEIEGTGLGLAISKEFIEAMGGSIAVESEIGKGSTFSITLNTA